MEIEFTIDWTRIRAGFSALVQGVLALKLALVLIAMFVAVWEDNGRLPVWFTTAIVGGFIALSIFAWRNVRVALGQDQ